MTKTVTFRPLPAVRAKLEFARKAGIPISDCINRTLEVNLPRYMKRAAKEQLRKLNQIQKEIRRAA